MRGKFILACFVLACSLVGAAYADEDEDTLNDSNVFGVIETGRLFGFLQGTDIGAKGDQDIESESNFEAKRRGSTYQTFSQDLSTEYAISRAFSVELAAHGNNAFIRNVAGLEDVHRTDFGGASVLFKSRLLARGVDAPFGVAVSLEPAWARLEDQSYARITGYSNELRVMGDTELIDKRLYFALNLAFEPSLTKDHGSSIWARASNLGASSALAYRFTPKLTLGANVEYLRQYDGTDLRKLVGQALFAGPMLHYRFTKSTYALLAFETQAAGRARGEHGALDLTNYARYRTKLRLGFAF